MKMIIKIIGITTIAIALIVLAQINSALAREDPIIIPWWTVIGSGGGGYSLGNVRMTMTFGQPIAGQVSAGPYTLSSGFLCFPKAPNIVPMTYILFLPLFTN